MINSTHQRAYQIMHGEKHVADIHENGICRILDGRFLPYDLWLEEAKDIDTRLNNLTNFYAWCSGRILTLDRKYAKEILNSIGFSQARTDRERAEIALSCKCLTLTDIWWVRRADENIHYYEVNLYENHLSNVFVDIALRGKQMTVTNRSFQADLSTGGGCPKAWLRDEKGFHLLKDGNGEMVDHEILASRIAGCFPCRQVAYHEGEYAGEKVSVSDLVSSLEYSMVSRAAYELYAVNHGFDAMEAILKLDGDSYYQMNIIDYLVGNTDRHWENWGLLVDNRDNRPICLYPLMDFNQSFHSYDTVDGANCLTARIRTMTQREAAVEAVRRIGLPLKSQPDPLWFAGREAEWEMFRKRMDILREMVPDIIHIQ